MTYASTEEADAAEDENSDSEDHAINPLVDALFDEGEQLRMQLYECEMRAVQQEQQIREEVANVMQHEMLEIERRWAKRWRSEVRLQVRFHCVAPDLPCRWSEV